MTQKEAPNGPNPSKYALDLVYGCRIWLGSVNGKGYGPHWETYTAATGIEPRRGLALDHFCRRRRCGRLEHLDLVSQAENERRKSARYRRTLSRCPQGHRLLPASFLWTPEGGIACLACR